MRPLLHRQSEPPADGVDQLMIGFGLQRGQLRPS
jgi:hypothetical protein